MLDTDEGMRPGFWFDVLPPGEVRVGVRDDAGARATPEVSATPGGLVGYLRSFDYDDSWIGRSVDVVPARPSPRGARAGAATASGSRSSAGSTPCCRGRPPAAAGAQP